MMISIIIPTYNESKNIEALVVRIKRSLSSGYELIIVDDASPDGTSQIAQKLSLKHPITLINRPKKLGLASAVLDGFKIAHGDLLCVMDSDLSHPPEIIPMLLRSMEEENADIIIGSRFIKGGAIENWSKKRLIATSLAVFSVRPLTSVKDPMSGFFIIKKGVVDRISLTPRGFKILLEILVKGKYKKVLESPFIFKDRVHGNSKLSLKVYLEYFTQLWDLYLYKLRIFFQKTL